MFLVVAFSIITVMYEHMRRISIAVTFAAYNSGRSVQIPHVAYAEFRFALDLNGRVLFLDCTAACWGITLGGASSLPRSYMSFVKKILLFFFFFAVFFSSYQILKRPRAIVAA